MGVYVASICIMGDPAGLLTRMELMKWQLGRGESTAEEQEVAGCVAHGTSNVFDRRSRGERLPKLSAMLASQRDVHAGDKLILCASGRVIGG